MKKILSICSIFFFFSCQNENKSSVESNPKDSITLHIDTSKTEENTTHNQRILTEIPSNLIIIATGTEPGWILNIYSDKYEFIGNYGKDTLRGERTFEAEQIPIYFTSSDLSFRIEQKHCLAISGDTLELSVEVKHKGNTYKGCGKIMRY